jgi:hypothetical protein
MRIAWSRQQPTGAAKATTPRVHTSRAGNRFDLNLNYQNGGGSSFSGGAGPVFKALRGCVASRRCDSDGVRWRCDGPGLSAGTAALGHHPSPLVSVPSGNCCSHRPQKVFTYAAVADG